MNAITKRNEGGAIAAPAGPAGGFTGISMMNPEKFEHMVRVGRMLGMSPLVPKHLREGGVDAATANGVLVLNMAERLGEDPLTVAQNIYFVNGSPGWNATYMISKANQHGVFADPIDWDVTGDGDNLSVTAFGTLATTGKKVKVTADMAMAMSEGWTRNSKYKSMPEQMLRYRSATMLIRLYCPEVMVGVPSVVELDDSHYRDVTPKSDTGPADDTGIMDAIPAESDAKKPTRRKAVDRTPPAPAKKEPDEVVDEETGEVLESKAEQEKPKPKAKPKPDPEPDPEPEPESEPEGEGDDDSEVDDAEDEKVSRLVEAIKADIVDGGADAAMSFYAEQIDEMKGKAPKAHAALMEFAKQAREADA